ncbi:protein of unknown function [Petrocella atlantisensis]|uniref:Uncharacterized protein n=1 Tax=Petrocella atlantisensis TaxID=2173034 RepID=A0A3P7PTI7_9FIRM|nr:protein of unknown function [Petrocella atlantisensis]
MAIDLLSIIYHAKRVTNNVLSKAGGKSNEKSIFKRTCESN